MSIPNESVEAAKKIAYERYGSKPDASYLRTILEAAAPHIRAEALEDAAAVAAEGGVPAYDSDDWADWLRARAAMAKTSPYRSQA